jgi:hypothetical protein
MLLGCSSSDADDGSSEIDRRNNDLYYDEEHAKRSFARKRRAVGARTKADCVVKPWATNASATGRGMFDEVSDEEVAQTPVDPQAEDDNGGSWYVSEPDSARPSPSQCEDEVEEETPSDPLSLYDQPIENWPLPPRLCSTAFLLELRRNEHSYFSRLSLDVVNGVVAPMLNRHTVHPRWLSLDRIPAERSWQVMKLPKQQEEALYPKMKYTEQHQRIYFTRAGQLLLLDSWRGEYRQNFKRSQPALSAHSALYNLNASQQLSRTAFKFFMCRSTFSDRADGGTRMEAEVYLPMPNRKRCEEPIYAMANGRDHPAFRIDIDRNDSYTETRCTTDCRRYGAIVSADRAFNRVEYILEYSRCFPRRTEYEHSLTSAAGVQQLRLPKCVTITHRDVAFAMDSHDRAHVLLEHRVGSEYKSCVVVYDQGEAVGLWKFPGNILMQNCQMMIDDADNYIFYDHDYIRVVSPTGCRLAKIRPPEGFMLATCCITPDGGLVCSTYHSILKLVMNE